MAQPIDASLRDLIVADEDGVVVVPQERAADARRPAQLAEADQWSDRGVEALGGYAPDGLRDALRQRDSLAKRLTGQPHSVFVRWRGTISPKMPAGAGHMGRGSRYMLVTEILELRPAEEAGCAKA